MDEQIELLIALYAFSGCCWIIVAFYNSFRISSFTTKLPSPLSMTRGMHSASSLFCKSRRILPPGRVYLAELPIRLISTWIIRFTSQRIVDKLLVRMLS